MPFELMSYQKPDLLINLYREIISIDIYLFLEVDYGSRWLDYEPLFILV